MLKHTWIPLTLVSCSISSANVAAPTGTTGPDQPVELGRVEWGRDLEVGLDTAESAQKPVLLLFQEIPG